MRKINLLKTFSFTMILGTSFLMVQEIYSQNRSLQPAPNCTYTGNPSDYCYASDGTNNLRVTNCRPGSTACYY